MDNWDNLRFLLALHRHRTMSAAAVALNTNVATVSRRIEKAALAFGGPLFVKDPTGWVPTEAAMPILRLAEDFSARLTAERNNRRADPAGGIVARVQISAPAWFNATALLPRLPELLAEHPRLQLDIRSRGDAVGLGDSDITLRIGRPESGRVVARRLVSSQFRAWRPQRPDWTPADWIAFELLSTTAPLLHLGTQVFGTEPRLVVPLFEQQLALMQRLGMGGVLPEEAAAGLPDFVPVPTDEPPVGMELWMIYHATRRDDAAIRAVSDWIVGCLRPASGAAAQSPGRAAVG